MEEKPKRKSPVKPRPKKTIPTKEEIQEAIGEELNHRQMQFCLEYVHDWNQTRAYMAAYKDVKNYQSAAVMAHNLLKNIKIKAYIELLMSDVAKTAGISRVGNLKGMLKIVRSKQSKPFEVVAAMKVINEMLGYNEAVKLDHRLNIQTVPFVIAPPTDGTKD